MTLRIMRDRQALLSAVVVAIAITTTGCHVSQPNPPTPSTEATKALDQLKSLPSLEDTTTQVRAAIDEITAAASKVIPGIVWTTAGNEDTGNCETPDVTNRLSPTGGVIMPISMLTVMMMPR